MDTLVLLGASIALIWKVVDGIKLLVPTLPPIAIQATAWAFGVVVAFLLGASDLAGAVQVGPVHLEDANAWTTALFGLALGSSASASVDVTKAIDNTRTSEPGATVIVEAPPSTTTN